MTKPGAKKTTRQTRKRNQKRLRHIHQKAEKTGKMPSSIAPTFSGEQLGAPTTVAAWFGQKFASFIRPHKH